MRSSGFWFEIRFINLDTENTALAPTPELFFILFETALFYSMSSISVYFTVGGLCYDRVRGLFKWIVVATRTHR